MAVRTVQIRCDYCKDMVANNGVTTSSTTPIAMVIFVTSSFGMDRVANLWVELEEPSMNLW